MNRTTSTMPLARTSPMNRFYLRRLTSGRLLSVVSLVGLVGLTAFTATPATAADLILDNGTTAFSVVGTWPTSTGTAGFEGANYQPHVGRPATRIVDNSQGTVTGTWALSTSSPGYYGTNYQTHAAGTGSNTFTWPLAVTSSASYRVYARWTAASNRATNAVYTVTHSTGSAAVTVNQQLNGNTWQLLGTYTLTSASRVSLSDAGNNYVIADAVKAEPVAELATATWTATLAGTSEYEVYAKWTAFSNRATNAVYTVRHNAGNTPVTVNQQLNNGQWNRLGRFTLAPGKASVTLSNDGANNYVIADAIKLSPVTASAKLYFLHTDQLNTPRLVTDETKKVVWRNSPLTEPFGIAPVEEDPDGDGKTVTLNLRFPGQYADKETNTSYNYFRDYDPSIGRYLESDPIGLQGGINTYQYVGGNPISRRDPFGLDWNFDSATGQWSHTDNATGTTTDVGTGYSGTGEGRNNPAMENVPNTGPIPRGDYDIGDGHNSTTTGPNTMNLTPQEGTDTHGRDLFRIHGNNAANDASHGCPIAPPAVRTQINNSTDHVLHVQ